MSRAKTVSRNGRPVTVKQQAFARAYVESGNASEAYRRAYNSQRMSANAVRVEAHRVLKRPNVALMVSQLQEEAAEHFELTHDGVVRMLLADRDTARELGQMASAVRADELIGKNLGMFKERVEVHPRTEVLAASLGELSREELRALARQARPEYGVDEEAASRALPERIAVDNTTP